MFKRDVLVIGSVNMDITAKVKEHPKLGETIKSKELNYNYGGKGANQAFAAARAGAGVALFGNVGNDNFGIEIKSHLIEAGIDCKYLSTSLTNSTGVAMIIVDEKGNNSIVIGAGANEETSLAQEPEIEAIIENSSYVLLQLEIPLANIEEIVAVANRIGRPVVLDPAPAAELSSALLSQVDILTPNQPEMHALTGIEVVDVESAETASHMLIQRGVSVVCAKLGEKGVLIVSADETKYIPGYMVNVVDTTAAGDVFAGVLTAKLAVGNTIYEAAGYANYAAAQACTKVGAQSSIPDLQELKSVPDSQVR